MKLNNINRIIHLFACGIFGLVLVTPVVSQPKIVEMDPFFVIDTRLSILNTSNTAEVEIGLSDGVAESLEGMSGLYIFQTSGLSGNSEVLIRGAESNFTKTYIDGVEVSDPTNVRGSGYPINHLGFGIIGKVEVTKGASSAIHGSEAMGGVLSMSLDAPSLLDPSLYATVSRGTHGYEFYSAGFNHLNANSGYRGAISHTVEDDLYDGCSYENTTGYLKWEHVFSIDRQLFASAWTQSTDKICFPDDSGGPLFAVLGELETQSNDELGVSVQYVDQSFKHMSWITQAGYFKTESVLDSPGVIPSDFNPFGVPKNSYDNDFERFQLDSFLRYSGYESVEFILGMNLKREDGRGESVTIYPFATFENAYEVERNFVSVFAEVGMDLDENQCLSMAARLDKVDSFDAEISPSLRYSNYIQSVGTEFSLMYDHGFKTPSMFALNNTLVGNPDLESETSDRYQVGLKKELVEDSLDFELSLFKQEFESLIDFSEQSFKLVNLYAVEISGAELALNWTPTSELRLMQNVTVMDVDTKQSGEILRHRPDWTLGSHVEWLINDQLSTQLKYVCFGERWDSSVPTGNRKLDVFHQLDWTLVYQYESCRISLSVQNLLNQKDEIAIGYKRRGTRAFLSLTCGF